MISVVLYGRNDAHGYNLHRRAALSLNCIAEVLTDAADEILFVDYNTPDELPTFIEALSDTLTDRCLDLLRVIRVPAAVHEERFGGRTHLPALEPVARNAAVRRANPANRWLLSTNTDMVFLPSAGGSLSDVCRELPDGFYGLPRYELPEWLWERLPRSDPGRALAEIARLGPTLRLDEPTLSNEWIRFDAPGDFQLVLREDFFAIDGFDEEMILGYHVDSNFSKRMLLHRGSIESLGERLAGYHCNHNRTPTVYHGAQKVTNDLERFFLSIERPELPAQRDSWGLVDDALEEVPVRERSGEHFAAAVAAATPAGAASREPSNAARIPYELTYDSGHVLPFVADSLAVTPPDATVGYVGANTVLQESLAALIAQLGSGRSLTVAELDDLRSLDGLAGAADVFVVDLGVDLSLLEGVPSSFGDHQPAQLPAKIARAFVAFERLVELERARVQAGAHPRRFVLVHSWTVFWDAYVLAHLDCSHATAHSRVRRATVRAVPIDDGRTRELVRQERRLIRWAGRGELGRTRLHLHPREPLVLAELSDYGGFGNGWAFPDESGLWTQGPRSEVFLALDGIDDGDPVLRLSLGSICVGSDSAMRVSALVNGKTVATRDFNHGDPDWHLELPVAGVTDGSLDLAFEIEEPGSPRQLGWSLEDDRPLGILLRTATLLPAGDPEGRAGLARESRLAAWAARGKSGERRLDLRPGETVELAELTGYGGFDDGWAYQDGLGIWTRGPRSQLALALEATSEYDYVIALALGSVCTEPGDTLTVELFVDGERTASRSLGYGEPEWRVELPAPVPTDGEVDVTFELDGLRSPLELGWSDDERPLGILLRSLRLDRVDRSVRPGEKVVFGEGTSAERLLGEGWSAVEPAGVWSDGERATLVLKLVEEVPDDAEVALSVSPFVTAEHPLLEVDGGVGGERLAARAFRHGEAPRLLRVPLPRAGGQTVVELTVRDPARPADLGLGDDQRRLGVQLRWLMVRKSTLRATVLDAARHAFTRLRRRPA